MTKCMVYHKFLQNRRLFKLAIILAGLPLMVLVGCSDKTAPKPKRSSLEGTIYDGWQEFTRGNVRILYPPGHPNQSDFGNICSNYSNSIKSVSSALGIPEYDDTLLFIYYSGYGQGRELTGQEYPFGTDTAIHFWLPSFPGPTLVEHLLPRWSNRITRHRFLRHGLKGLFDFSGQKYHESTIGYINSGKFIHLKALAVDTAINSNTERYQTAEAASFCAFILGNYGLVNLKQLYESELPFDLAVKKQFAIPVDSLESLWMLYVRQNVPSDSLRGELP